MRRWWSILLILLAACVAAPPPSGVTPVVAPVPIPATAAPEVTLENFGPAPELTNENWLNTSGQALRLADLPGKVVAIDMWTYG